MMSTAVKSPKPLLAPVLTSIPLTLRNNYPRRWSVWTGDWDAVKGKWNKIPVRVNNLSAGLSSRDTWFTFAEAAEAYSELSLVSEGGVGFNMTHVKDLVGIDLDHCCTSDGALLPWAQAIVDRAKSYAEISPSGNGARIFVRGSIAQDWTNHEQGIEVYGGNAPRFLTVTGQRIGIFSDVNAAPTGFFDWLAEQYRKQREVTASDLPDDMPDLLPEDRLPDLHELNLPAAVLGFLTGKVDVIDRSGALQAASIALYEATAGDEGELRDDVVLSILNTNDFAWAVAMDHRRQDPDRALTYLWEHHCLKARGKASPPSAVINDFDVIELTEEEKLAEELAKQAIVDRFQLIDLADFTAGQSWEYLIKGILPKAEVGVLFGESGSGKSFFVLDMAVHIARGTEWRGRRVKPGRVVYICAEGAGGFRKRGQAYAIHHGVDLKEIPIKVLADAPNFLSNDDHKKVASRIKEAWGGADLIVVDTLAQTTPGANENAAEDMGKALGNLKALHRATGAMVLLVHHSGKDASKGARGWSGLKAAADVEIEISRLDRCRVARISKSKDDEDGVEFGFELEVVPVGADEDGDAVTSCVAVPAEVDRSKTSPFKPGSALQQTVLDAIMEMAEFQSAGIEVDAVVEAVLPKVPEPEKGKRDTRRQKIRKALERLCSPDDSPLFMEDGCICIA